VSGSGTARVLFSAPLPLHYMVEFPMEAHAASLAAHHELHLAPDDVPPASEIDHAAVLRLDAHLSGPQEFEPSQEFLHDHPLDGHQRAEAASNGWRSVTRHLKPPQ